MTTRQLAGYFLGQKDYRSCLALQEQLHAARTAGALGDTVLFVEHPAVSPSVRATVARAAVAVAVRVFMGGSCRSARSLRGNGSFGPAAADACVAGSTHTRLQL